MHCFCGSSTQTGRPGVISLSGAVLAGGASKRMGRDKAFVEVAGKPLFEGAVHALIDAGAAEVVVVGGDSHAIRSRGFTYLPDIWPGEGPLGGIITALRAADSEVVGVLSCDLVTPSSIAIGWLVDEVGEADVAVPITEGQAEWLHAVWHIRALPVIEAAFEAGVRAPRQAASSLHVARLFGGDPRWFDDADSPEDLW